MTPLDGFVSTWAQRSPDSIAISSRQESTSYSDLDRLANRFAHAFVAGGLQPGDRVGIQTPKSARGVAAMIGALRAGGVYVPIDPQSPPVRASLIANDCDLRQMVISPRHLVAWQAAGLLDERRDYFLSDEVAALGETSQGRIHPWSEIVAAKDTPMPSKPVGLDDLAYMLYTSGSTGIPKGVMISFRNALAFVEWAGDEISLSAADRVASHAPFHFDLSVFDLYSTFRAGATVVLIEEDLAMSAAGLVDRIHDDSITVWYSVPSALVLMLERGRLEARGAPSVRVVFFAGEVFPIKYLRRLMLALSGARFYNLFGPTETNVCLYYEVPRIPEEDAPPVPAGGPACGDQAFVLNPDGEPVDGNEIGELFIEGPTVMLGYWDGGRRSPALHPYPTGDRVSREPDGALRYHGRRDHMIKIRGYRIEIGEVEAGFLKHPEVREAVVMALDQKLVAVVVPRADSLSVLTLKRHCATILPGYMVPHEIVLAPNLPKTSTGKVDRVSVMESFISGTLESRASLNPASSERTGDADAHQR